MTLLLRVIELNIKGRFFLLLLCLAIISSSAVALHFLWRTSNSTGLREGGGELLGFPSGLPSLPGGSALTIGLQREEKIIHVSGSGMATAQADEATVILGVQTEDKTASQASKRNAVLMISIINALKDLGLTEEGMKTISYSVFPVYSKSNYSEIVGYRVINMISVRVEKIDLVGTVIDVATENGANRIQGVSFGLSVEKQEELKREAYLAALRDAESKASLIADALNITITGVYSISESVYQPYRPYYEYRYAVAGAETPTTPILEGKLSVSVTVQVAYLFE